MKKRALISAVAGIALAGVLAVGFAACGGVNAKSVKGEEVNEETWTKALTITEYDNFKVAASDEYEMKYGDATVKISANYTITVVGDNQYVKGKTKTTVKGDVPKEMGEYKSETVSVEYYINKDGERIAKKDGNWAKITDATELMKYGVNKNYIVNYVDSAFFTSYEFKADQKGYVLKDDEKDCLHIVKIKDGKFAAAYVEEKEDNGILGSYSRIGNVVVTHGGQKLTLPTV